MTTSPGELKSLVPRCWPDRIGKRLFDLIGAALALVVLLPVLLVCALTIKLTSRGPIFFRQPRAGRKGQVFNIWKLRTLHYDQCDRPDQPYVRGVIDRDGRVFTVGRFLRERGLDEIPQLWNVLRGEMS